MADIREITDLSAPELDVFARLTEAQLRNRLEPEKGVFIAESPKVIQTALDAGLSPVSFLMEQRHIGGDAAPLLARFPDIPVYTADYTVNDVLRAAFSGLDRIKARMRELEGQMTEHTPKEILSEYDALTNRFEAGGGYEIEETL